MELFYTARLVVLATLCICNVKSYKAKICEKKCISECSEKFKNVWKYSGENEVLRDVYCRAYETIGRCFISTTVYRLCFGKLLDITRMLVSERMLMDKRTGVCPKHSMDNLKKLVEAHLGDEMTSKHLKKIDSDKIEPCAVKINHECANYIARNMIHNFKKKKSCVASSVQKIYDCYESKVNEDCDAELYRDYLNTIEKYGRLTSYMQSDQHMLKDCDGSEWLDE